MLEFVLASRSLIIIDDKLKTVAGIRREHADLLRVFNRKLVFVQLPKEPRSLEIYIALLSSNCVPLFLPQDIPSDAFEKLVEQFNPAIVISSEHRLKKINMYYFLENWLDIPVFGSNNSHDGEIDGSLCLLAATSGSTGSPKLVPQTYEIISIAGKIYKFTNDQKKCFNEMEKIFNELKLSFPNSKIVKEKEGPHDADKSGKSFAKVYKIYLKNGRIAVTCTDWSQDTGRPDSLKVAIHLKDYMDWINNEAYE